MLLPTTPRARSIFATLLVASVATSTSLGHAADGDAARAEALFEAALAAASAGRLEEACPKFRESYELDPGTGTLFNLGECEEKRGQSVAALVAFEQLVTRLPAGHEKIPGLQARIAELDSRVGRLTIQLAGDAPADSRVRRGGEPLDAAGLGRAMPVEPGEHVVEVTSGGSKRSYRVRVAAGAREELEVTPLERAPVSTAPGPEALPEDAAPRSGMRTAALVTGAVGLVGVGVGAVTGVLVMGKKSEVEEKCPGGECFDATGLDAASSGRTLSTVSTVAFGVGAAGLVAGITMWMLAPADPPATARRRHRPVAIDFQPTPGGGFLNVGGTF